MEPVTGTAYYCSQKDIKSLASNDGRRETQLDFERGLVGREHQTQGIGFAKKAEGPVAEPGRGAGPPGNASHGNQNLRMSNNHGSREDQTQCHVP